MSATVSDLPKRFEAINTIQSIEQRLHLTTTVVDIFNIIKSHSVPPNAKTKKMVDGFLRHLESSCESPKILTRRALWLGTYADIVLRNLGDKHFGVEAPLALKVDPHFVDKITYLIEAVAFYRVGLLGSVDRDVDTITLLEQLLDLSERVMPDHDNAQYDELMTAIDNCRIAALTFSGSGARGCDEYEYIIIRYLLDIQNLTKNYMLDHKMRASR